MKRVTDLKEKKKKDRWRVKERKNKMDKEQKRIKTVCDG